MPTGLSIWKRTVSGNEFFYHWDCVTKQMRRDDIGCHAWDASMVKQEIACQGCGQPIDRQLQKSNRKPFNVNAGYVASKINPLTGIANVIYIASEAGIDACEKYVTVCEKHHLMISSTNIPQARNDMKDASGWCAECQKLSK